jgi:hypothetical protein
MPSDASQQRILGIDPGLNVTGYGVVQFIEARLPDSDARSEGDAFQSSLGRRTTPGDSHGTPSRRPWGERAFTGIEYSRTVSFLPAIYRGLYLFFRTNNSLSATRCCELSLKIVSGSRFSIFRQSVTLPYHDFIGKHIDTYNWAAAFLPDSVFTEFLLWPCFKPCYVTFFISG